MEMHFKIGEMADMFETSIRALRLYDKIGLFKPEYTDEQTGYRYYTADQVSVLNTILVFKSIGVKLTEIKRLFDNGINPEELLKLLKDKQDFWENQIEIAKYNVENIEHLKKAAKEKLSQVEEENREVPDAHKMSRLVCLENIKIDNILSEVLWL